MDIQRIKAAKCQIANVPKLSIAGVADLKYTICEAYPLGQGYIRRCIL
jgi:hypothetical protein